MIIDAIMSVVPERFRKEAVLVSFGIALATAWFVLDARIAAAEDAAKAQPGIRQEVNDLRGNMSVLRQQTTDIQTNVALVTAALLGQRAVAGHVAVAAPNKIATDP